MVKGKQGKVGSIEERVKKMKLGLCKGRHDIPEVSEYIFEEIKDVTDLDALADTCHEVLENCKELDLYVTGLTVALTTVINYCVGNLIPLTLHHYDRDLDGYFPQVILTDYYKAELIEGGYIGR